MYTFPDNYRDKGTALLTAIAHGDISYVRAAIEAGADATYEDNQPVRTAAYTGQLAIMQFLVTQGADIRANNDEALLYAAKRGDKDMTRWLLEQGADVAVMKQHHRKLVDDECLSTFRKIESDEQRKAFEENHKVFRKPNPGARNDFRL